MVTSSDACHSSIRIIILLFQCQRHATTKSAAGYPKHLAHVQTATASPAKTESQPSQVTLSTRRTSSAASVSSVAAALVAPRPTSASKAVTAAATASGDLPHTAHHVI